MEKYCTKMPGLRQLLKDRALETRECELGHCFTGCGLEPRTAMRKADRQGGPDRRGRASHASLNPVVTPLCPRSQPLSQPRFHLNLSALVLFISPTVPCRTQRATWERCKRSPTKKLESPREKNTNLPSNSPSTRAPGVGQVMLGCIRA